MKLKHLPVAIAMYIFESFLLAVPVGLVWKYFLATKFGMELGYFDWVCIFFIFKLLINNVLAVLQTYDAMLQEQKQIEKNEI